MISLVELAADLARLRAVKAASDAEEREFRRLWNAGDISRDYHRYFFHTDFVMPRVRLETEIKELERVLKYLLRREKTRQAVT